MAVNIFEIVFRRSDEAALSAGVRERGILEGNLEIWEKASIGASYGFYYIFPENFPAKARFLMIVMWAYVCRMHRS
jgi:hypothetical protein